MLKQRGAPLGNPDGLNGLGDLKTGYRNVYCKRGMSDCGSLKRTSFTTCLGLSSDDAHWHADSEQMSHSSGFELTASEFVIPS